jgi:hypothetical protein
MVKNISRFLPVGEKIYITKIDVHLKSDKILLAVIECDACNGAQQSSYMALVNFEFPKGYLEKADVGQVQDVIAQVFASDTSTGNANAGNAQQQAPADQQAPASQPATIQMGQSIDEVRASLGAPEKIVDLGKKQIYVYKDLKVTFLDGKVADVQ